MGNLIGNVFFTHAQRKDRKETDLESLEINAVYDPLGAATLKYGPVISDKINTEALRAEMLRLANLFRLTGIVNLDLFYVYGE